MLCSSGTRFLRGLQPEIYKLIENSGSSGTRFKGICITLMLLLVIKACLSYVITRALPKYLFLGF